MRKVTKILAKLLSATVLLLIILPLTLSLSLSLSAVQNFAVDCVTRFASSYVGSQVSVGEVSFSMLKQFTLSDVVVEDLEAQQMLSLGELGVSISALSLRGKSLVIGRVKARDGFLRLREVEPGELNIKQIVDRISSGEGSGQFSTTIQEIEVEGLNFNYQRMEPLSPNYGIDMGNILIEGLGAKLTNFNSHEGVLSLSIEQLSGVEQSGLSIESFKGDLVIYEGVIDFVDVVMTTQESFISLPRLRTEATSWEEYKAFESAVSLDISSEASIISLGDVAYFSEELRGKDLSLHSLTATLNGTIDRLEARLENLSFGEDSRLAADVSVEGVTNFARAKFELGLESVESNIKDIEELLAAVGAPPIEGEAREVASKLNNFRAKASIGGSLSNLNLDATLITWLGEASYVGTLSGVGSSALALSGVGSLSSLNLGALLSNPALGSLTLSSELNYEQSAEGLESDVAGYIASVGYNGVTYNDITFEGRYDGHIVDAVVVSSDQKIDFNLAALLKLSTSEQDDERHYDVTMRINDANLAAMGLNTRDSISQISGSVRLNLGGNTLDNLSGVVTLRNINYDYNQESLYTPIVTLTARNSDQSKFIELKSELLDMTFNSRSSFEALYQYLSEGMRAYIPMLYNEHTERTNTKRVTIVDNYSTLKVNIKKGSQLSDILYSGLEIADNSSLNFMVNPFSERFSLRLQSDYIQHNNLAATELNLSASNDNDSLALYASASDIYAGRTSFSSYTLMAGARDNVVELSTGFRDPRSSTSATLGMRVGFDEQRRANIALLPSNVTLGEDVWMISANNITGDESGLVVNNFELVNGAQHLSLNGVVSSNPTDSLVLKLDNYDISMITSVINDLGYSVAGLSNGYVNMRELLTSPRVIADVRLDQVDVNSIPSPALRLRAGWNSTQNRAGVSVTNAESSDTVVLGYYAPADGRYYAHLKVDSFNMSLIDPVLSTTIADTRGYANVDVSLNGKGKDVNLHGGIDIYDLSTRILYTQVEYSVPSAYIAIDDNKISSMAQTMLDSEGNRGLLTINLSLDHLSNVSYKMRVVPENMMVLNTTAKDNELFYGTIFASGVATIEGDKRGVNIDITATSKPNSNFYMPLSTKAAVAKTDFITFVQEVDVAPESDAEGAVNFRQAFLNERQERLNTANTTSVNVNLSLHATPDLDFQLVIDPVVGDIIKARGEGRLNLNIAPQDNIFEMYGDYNIEEGNYLFTLLNPISKRFVIDAGSSIQWSGDPLDPMLAIDAVYKVKTSLDPLINSTSEYSSESSSRALPVDCIIHIGDRLAQPSVTFGIEVPTADTEQQAVIANTLIDQETISQQFFYLMFANSFIPVSSSYGGLTSSTTASTGFELLTNQLSNWLSSSNYNIVIRYRPESELTSDEIDVGFSRGFINNRLLFEGELNYLADNKAAIDEDPSNYMGEAYITWLIDREGALRLKGFTQTIDQYDENQGLQETGIGIYYKESFNSFKELGGKVRDRFRRKNRDLKE